ncbi:MAG: tRNA (N6-isopentenyl adenosine(37)-C2)-methylthiotransferase MiaB [Patescibacteria group bacterium]|nr:tRNA (N6-isopentenyl adenosine(37)-C2)-methylthiotransferase MiaB [Patescibacteria group bacterium]MDD5294446.1 tRNA (N6-isopentenyl adenosine(37)-C2)-methylthiotransferase MiaB [Patescibacteria group bacterium]MDD5554998.1 tRNA (N6-isopentenyl adenosine(37)-C2)-methylthiotransferase MiaB [Patescibacteria group bacterium]
MVIDKKNNKISNGVKNKKTYYIITIGCQMNKSDSERVAAYLEKYGFSLARNETKADLVVLTTCGVRQAAEDRVYGLVGEIKRKNPKAKIVLTGCLSERKDVKKRLGDKVDVWLPISQILNFKFQILKKIRNPKSEIRNCDYLKIKPKYSSKFSAFLAIGNGCNNFCAYCVVPYARGREVYRPAKEILAEAKNLIKNGYREVILIAQNVNSYKDGKINFSKLLKIVNNIPGDFWIRFATSHPKDMSNELIKTMTNCGRVCKHIHLPVQAGNDKVLKAMNRNYTVAHYKNLIKNIRQAMPEASITTDVIVGFPGETKKQFSNTAKLFRKIKFDMAYIARYSPRPGTAAYKLKDDVAPEEKKRREEELMKILRKTALENNEKYLGKTIEVLISGKNKRGEWYGYTGTNKNVKIRITNYELRITNLTGKFVKVKITKVRDFGLEGTIV